MMEFAMMDEQEHRIDEAATPRGSLHPFMAAKKDLERSSL